MEHLVNYGWPRNARELQSAIERLVIKSIDDVIGSESLSTVMTDLNNSIEDRIEGLGTLKESVDTFEKQKTLKEMSRYLKVDTSTLSRKFKKYGVELR